VERVEEVDVARRVPALREVARKLAAMLRPVVLNAPAYITPTIGDPCLDEGGLDQNIYDARL
jgi:hypothetical protein